MTKREIEEHQACPCLHIEPCDPRCTCRDRFSSYGCTRCCSYGSVEQQRATAREFADRDARLARLAEAVRVFLKRVELIRGTPLHANADVLYAALADWQEARHAQ